MASKRPPAFLWLRRRVKFCAVAPAASWAQDWRSARDVGPVSGIQLHEPEGEPVPHPARTR